MSQHQGPLKRLKHTRALQVYENIVPLVAEDIADQIIYATTRPRMGGIIVISRSPLQDSLEEILVLG